MVRQQRTIWPLGIDKSSPKTPNWFSVNLTSALLVSVVFIGLMPLEPRKQLLINSQAKFRDRTPGIVSIYSASLHFSHLRHDFNVKLFVLATITRAPLLVCSPYHRENIGYTSPFMHGETPCKLKTLHIPHRMGIELIVPIVQNYAGQNAILRELAKPVTLNQCCSNSASLRFDVYGNFRIRKPKIYKEQNEYIQRTRKGTE